MNFSRPFIERPVATTLLTLALVLAGLFGYSQLPISPLPQVDFPTIQVQASMPGASPDTMASSVAAPLERHLGQIADLSEMTSSSTVGQTRVVLQFGLDRNINGAARDVQAAINAARADLPTALRQNPSYEKVNPADSPIMILAITSGTLTTGQMYDRAATVLAQKLSQLGGVGNVEVNGGTLPAVRVELDPGPLFKYGIGLEDVRAALASANARSPKGVIEEGTRRLQIYTNDTADKAALYRDLVIAYRRGAAIRLRDVAEVTDSVENLRTAGFFNGKPTVTLSVFRQPGANIVATADGVRALLPQLRADLPQAADLTVAQDRTPSIRASLADTQRSLVIATLLVIAVVFVFLRNLPSVLVPAVAVPVSIIGTFAGMALLGYSLDSLSLMALTVATGFVVDDAVVVLENIARHVERGTARLPAALLGASEVGFTVVSMSVSLIAVFIPILLMGGLVGRLFREFAVTLSIAIAISLVVSLTTTPMMCSLLLRPPRRRRQGFFDRMQRGYQRSLLWSLDRPGLIGALLLLVTLANVALFLAIPKAFFPQQDNGILFGAVQADQATSFQSMREKLRRIQAIVRHDPDVAAVVGYTGGRQTNTANMFVALKPLAQRGSFAPEIIARLRARTAGIAGARLLLQAAQDIRIGGRPANALYQYTLQADDSSILYAWTPKLTEALSRDRDLADVNSNQQQGGSETMLKIDRPTAARLGVTPAMIDNTLYDAFGQRQVSTIYAALNQYHVVMELAPQYWQSPQTLRDIWVSTSGGNASGTQNTNFAAGFAGPRGTAASVALDAARNRAQNALAVSGRGAASSGAAVSTAAERMVPLASFSTFAPASTPLAVNHEGSFVASTLSFNLAPGVPLSRAVVDLARDVAEIGMPTAIQGSFGGTAGAFQSALNDEPALVLAALGAVYIVLGILYESFLHPLTILSTLPSAGIGAVLALLLFGADFTLIALIGLILLIGIVKKNAILMIDFALHAQREGLSPRDAIASAATMRLRPILMTSFAALLGAMPLAFDTGAGAELRRPLGIAIMGGLIASQILTLYTTPIVYLLLDRATAVGGKRPGGSAPWTPAKGYTP